LLSLVDEKFSVYGSAAGIGLVALPVAYATGGFGGHRLTIFVVGAAVLVIAVAVLRAVRGRLFR
jgi:amino acid permease